ncbi:hypothetical protein CASFOL_018407 [Castilleja foliolosa]|uniref:Uncharacterized protein n=1 Tax=Castilleja foliolosa TaxID=1961234 RepID=A0ABD3D9Y7_9LAMI
MEQRFLPAWDRFMDGNFLQGRNIYDSCCQLYIQFSNFDELQINFDNEHPHDITVPTATIECKTENRHNAHVDYTDDVKNLSTTDIAHMNDVIVDVCDIEEPVPQTTQVEVPDMVVFLNKEWTELNDLEVRESLTSSEIPGDDMPIGCGSAFALEVLMASPKNKSSENEKIDIYKLVDLSVIAIGERSYPNVISFLIYTLRTRWFFKRGRMLWLCTGLRGRGSKSGPQVETRLKESKVVLAIQLYYLAWLFI